MAKLRKYSRATTCVLFFLHVNYLAIVLAEGNNYGTGYSLAFQGGTAVAGMKRAEVNWTSPKLVELANTKNFSFSGWIYVPKSTYKGDFFSWLTDFELVRSVKLSLFQIYLFGDVLSWENGQASQPKSMEQDKWIFLSLVVEEGKITTFIDGKLENTKQHNLYPNGFTLGDLGPSYFLLGSSLKINFPFNEEAKVDYNDWLSDNTNFRGKIDDFTIWSKALSQADITSLMESPLEHENLPKEAVFHYNFDILGCNGVAKTLYQDESCDITGTGFVSNYGTAGSDYDLLLGMLNDDNGFGQNYADINEINTNSPALYRFNFPTISLNTPFNKNPHVNGTYNYSRTPYTVQVQDDDIIQLKISENLKSAVLTGWVPAYGTLFKGSDSSSVVRNGDDVSAETFIWYHSPNRFSMFAPVSLKILEVKNTTSDISYLRHYHIWPYKKPNIISSAPNLRRNNFNKIIREGEYYMVFGRNFVYSLPGEDLEMRILKGPQHGIVYGMTLVHYYDDNRARMIGYSFFTDTAVISDSQGLSFTYFANQGFSGKDTIEVKFASASTGLESDTLIIEFTILEEDDLPNVHPQNVTMLEDGKYVNISLPASDQERTFGLITTVTSLPLKGKLYNLDHNGILKPIEESYSPYRTFFPFAQYAKRVRKVSSFPTWSDLSYDHNHPMHVLGPGTCNDRGSRDKCLRTFVFDREKHLNTLYRINIYQEGSQLEDPSKTPLFLVCKVISVHGDGSNMTFFVEVLPNYKQTESKTVLCILDRGQSNKESLQYPLDCDEKIASNLSYPFIISAKAEDLKYTVHRAWKPLSSMYDFLTYLDGGDPSARFGEEYRFVYNKTDLYGKNVLYKYTEFIELEFDQSVYPLEVEVGFPKGGGAIVSVQAESPDGWIHLYQGDPQKEKNILSRLKDSYFVFKEDMCTQNFRTNAIRLELDTSRATGITEEILMDYVKLIGDKSTQSSVLPYGMSELVYIPDNNTFGEDSFGYTAWDCGGNSERKSSQGDVDIFIKASQDAPSTFISMSSTKYDNGAFYALCLDDKENPDSLVNFTFTSIELDNELVAHRIHETTKYGNLVQDGNILGLNSEILQEETYDGSKLVSTFMIRYQPSIICSNPELSSGSIDRFSIVSTDSSGLNTSTTIDIRILKENKRLPRQAKTVASILTTFNFIVCILGVMWIYYFRNHPIVKAAQKDFLLLIFLGCMLSTITIFLMSIDDGEDSSNQAMADSACVALPWIYMLGFMMTYVPLYAKLKKAYMIFDINNPLKSTRHFLTGQKSHHISTMLVNLSWLFFIDVILLVIWSVVAPMSFIRYPVHYSDQFPDFVVESIGTCSSTNSSYLVFFGTMLAYHVGVLCYIAYFCFQTLHINDAFSESKYLRVAIFSSLQLLIFSIAITIVMGQNVDPETTLFIRAGVIFVNDLSVLIFIIAPKIRFIQKGVISDEGAGGEIIRDRMSSLVEKKKRTKVYTTESSNAESTAATSFKTSTGRGTQKKNSTVTSSAVHSSAQ